MVGFMVPQCVYVSCAAFNLWNEIQYEILEDKPRMSRILCTFDGSMPGECEHLRRKQTKKSSSLWNRQFIHWMHLKDTLTHTQTHSHRTDFSVCSFLVAQIAYFFFFFVVVVVVAAQNTSRTRVMRIELKLVAFLSIHHRNLHGSPAVWQYKIVCSIAFVTLFVAGYYSFYSVRGLVTRLIFCSSFCFDFFSSLLLSVT